MLQINELPWKLIGYMQVKSSSASCCFERDSYVLPKQENKYCISIYLMFNALILWVIIIFNYNYIFNIITKISSIT